MSNLYVVDVDESELTGTCDAMTGLPSLFEGADTVLDQAVSLWQLLDVERARRPCFLDRGTLHATPTE